MYICLSIFPPEFLETIYSKPEFGILCLLLLILLIIYAFKKYRFIIPRNKRVLIFSLLWFTALILPALPTLMRWYVFGATVATSILLSDLYNSIKSSKTVSILFMFILLAVGVFNFYEMTRWVKVSRITRSIAECFKSIKTDDCNIVYLWGSPDKIDFINSMKLGANAMYQYKASEPDIDVEIPLRTEISSHSHININKINDKEYELALTDGRFIPLTGKSRFIRIREEFSMNTSWYDISVNNSDESDTIPSIARVIFKQPFNSPCNIFFDGEKFVRQY